jgi:UDP-glucose:glycoprotein glucosyltransferase
VYRGVDGMILSKMGVLKIPWGLAGALLVTTYLHALRAAASPSINVALKTSFDSAPYLLELLYVKFFTLFK